MAIEKDLSKKINDIDTIEKNNILDENEIDKFLEDQERVADLWKLMSKNFETQSETLDQFKENIGKICERILRGETIFQNQWRILIFYLKHFHKENSGVGREIIKSIIEWSKWNRYQNMMYDIVRAVSGKKNITWEERENAKKQVDERFDKLPWTDEAKEERKKAQDLKKCDQIISRRDVRLKQEEIQWLEEYIKTPGLDSEVINRINARFDFEKCLQLLDKSEDLTTEELLRLDSYKNNGSLGFELKQSIKGKISMQGLKKCNELLASSNLSQEDIHWLNEYKVNGANEWWLIGKIDGKICDVILDSKDRLSAKDIQWLKEYKKNGAWYISQDTINRIDQRLDLEATNEEISQQVDRVTSSNRLANLDAIDTRLKTLQPNRNLIVKNIRTMEQVEEKINIDNIFQYLPIPQGINISDANKLYLTSNFKAILTKHLSLHPNYERWYGKNPNEKMTIGNSLKSIIDENNAFENAANTFEKLKWNNNLALKINTVMSSNNHILFDFWFRYEISKCNTNEKKWEKLYSIFSWIKNTNTLNNFVSANWFIREMYTVYIEARKEQMDREAEIATIEQAKIYIPYQLTGERDEFTYVFTVQQLKQYKNFYKQKWWKDFDNLYEASQKFYNSEFVKSTWLPNCLHPRQYFDYVIKMDNMNQHIKQIRQSSASQMDELAWKRDSGDGEIDAEIVARGTTAMRKIDGYRLSAARDFVTLWMKSPWKYRPTHFMWFPLRRNDSKWRPRGNVEEIIRDTFWEWVSDHWDDFKKNLKNDRQKAFGDLAWLIGGTVVAAMITASWWWSIAAGLAFEAWSRAINAQAQEYRNAWERALSKVWLFKENWNNRVDKLGESYMLWMWLMERDKNWKPQRVPFWKWLTNVAFSTAGNMASFGLFKAWKIFKHPYIFSTIDNFASKPLTRSLQAWTLAHFWYWEDKNVWFWEAFWNQLFGVEFSKAGFAQKLVSTFAMWMTISWVWNYLWKINWGRIPSFIWKLNLAGDRVKNFLQAKGNAIFTENGELVENVVNSELESLVNEYSSIAAGWWKLMRNIIFWPLVTYDLLSEDASPLTIVGRRISAIKSRISSAKWQREREKYNNLLADYEKIKDDLISWKLSLDFDEASNDDDNSLTAWWKWQESVSVFWVWPHEWITVSNDTPVENRSSGGGWTTVEISGNTPAVVEWNSETTVTQPDNDESPRNWIMDNKPSEIKVQPSASSQGATTWGVNTDERLANKLQEI